jgi:hypothetical protein
MLSDSSAVARTSSEIVADMQLFLAEAGITEGDNHALLEGDIVSWDSSRDKRSLMKDRDLTWPGGVIPFEISPRFGKQAATTVHV